MLRGLLKLQEKKYRILEIRITFHFAAASPASGTLRFEALRSLIFLFDFLPPRYLQLSWLRKRK